MVQLSYNFQITPAANKPSPVWQTFLGNNTNQYWEEYHNNPRSYIVDFFKGSPNSVLEVGCGCGATLKYVKQRYPQCRTIGVELNEHAAEAAKQVVNSVYCTDFAQFDFEAAGLTPGEIEVILFLDVLEHMYDPWRALLKAKKLLAPSGQVIASIPNVRNLWLIDQLTKGAWTYESDGLLDITHIRFFTLAEIRKLFDETGYRINDVRSIPDLRVQIKMPPGSQLTNVQSEKLIVKNVTPQEAAEFSTMQFIVSAQPK